MEVEGLYREKGQLFSTKISWFLITAGENKRPVGVHVHSKVNTSGRAHISRKALPGRISSISMNEKQQVLVERFFGLKCLNSKKIAEPEEKI